MLSHREEFTPEDKDHAEVDPQPAIPLEVGLSEMHKKLVVDKIERFHVAWMHAQFKCVALSSQQRGVLV
eukprot:4564655-Amphidinium_carterae.3